MSAAYNKPQFIAHFTSLHRHSTQPVLINQLLTKAISNTFSEFWILYDDYNRPIACAGANTVISDRTIGYVGLFEAKTEEAGTAVLNAATQWLRNGGLRQFEPVRQILGPVNMTTWLQYRVRVDNEAQPSMSFEPRNPEFYQECFAKAGFVKAVDYYSCFFDMDDFLDGYSRYTENITLEQLGLKAQYWNTLDLQASLNPEKHPELSSQDDIAKRVYNLTLEMFRGKDFFDEEYSLENHRKIGLNDMISRPEVDNASLLDLSSIIVDTATGKDVGFLACWVENQSLIVKTTGFVSRLRKTKAFAINIRDAAIRAKEYWGCTRAVAALMNSDTAGLVERCGGNSVRHVYRLYMHNPNTETVSIEQSLCTHVAEGQPPLSETLRRQPTANMETLLSLETDGLAENLLQKRETDLRVQMFLEKQRQRYLAQRSRGRPMARM
ncbi:hypothetical protein BGZ49_006941 [Haplosporangium sp. Z 27]|nr:hypothetical protein BGZ49_006941 [Haplosporangium sp. Z 27]